jgi:hypothetical protein
MSLNELAIVRRGYDDHWTDIKDLTCDPATFILPGDDAMVPQVYQVHAGFLKIAQVSIYV